MLIRDIDKSERRALLLNKEREQERWPSNDPHLKLSAKNPPPTTMTISHTLAVYANFIGVWILLKEQLSDNSIIQLTHAMTLGNNDIALTDTAHRRQAEEKRILNIQHHLRKSFYSI